MGKFVGIPANPEYEVLIEALKIIKKKYYLYASCRWWFCNRWGEISIRLLLNMMANLGTFYKKELEPKKEPRTFASVLTLPATGSEMNSGSVISRRATKQKLAMGGILGFSLFSLF